MQGRRHFFCPKPLEIPKVIFLCAENKSNCNGDFMKKNLFERWKEINNIKVCRGGVYFFLADEAGDANNEKTLEELLSDYKNLMQKNLILEMKLNREKKRRLSLQEENKKLTNKSLEEKTGGDHARQKKQNSGN